MKLVQVVKSIGRYQWFLICLLAASDLTQPTNYGILIFAPNIPFRCTDFNSTDSQCSMHLPVTADVRPNLTTYENREIKCENFEFEDSKFEWTLTERFNLVCDRRYIISMMKSIYIAGYFIGALGSGMFSDRFGRRRTVLVTSAVAAVVCVGEAAVPDVWAFLVLRFLLAVAEMACYVNLYILTTESIRKDERIVVKLIDSTVADVCTALFGALTFVVSNYAHFHIIFAVLFATIFLVTFLCFFESPRWLSAKEGDEKAKEIVAKISKINKVENSDVMFLLQSNEQNKHASVLDLFRTPLIRKRTLILCTVWFVFVAGYYAITLNLSSFTNDIRLSLLVSGCIEIPSTLPTALLMKKLGRRMTLFGVLILAGLCCLGMSPLVETPSHPALISLALMGKLLLSNTFFILYVYTPELFPTCVRASGLGLCSTSSRLVAALAPQMNLLTVYWPPLMVVTLGLGLLLVAFLVPMLPDMTGMEMPQTIDDGENLFKNQDYSLRKARVTDV